MKQWSSIISGLAGSTVLTILHETLKRTVKDSPRMDKLGTQALSKIVSASGTDVPPENDLQKIALGGDIAGNAMYYSMVGLSPKYSLYTGAALGLAAGLGAVALPGKMGLNDQYSNATNKTRMLTVLLYVTGGIVAGAVHKMIRQSR